MIPPGKYEVHDILVMVGSGTVEGRDAQKSEPGVMIGNVPIRPKTTLVSTVYEKVLLSKFTVRSGQIVYFGDYSYESKFEPFGPGVTINRTFDHTDKIFSDIIAEHPNMPDSMRVVSLEYAMNGAQDFDIAPPTDEQEDVMQPVIPDEEGTPIVPPQTTPDTEPTPGPDPE